MVLNCGLANGNYSYQATIMQIDGTTSTYSTTFTINRDETATTVISRPTIANETLSPGKIAFGAAAVWLGRPNRINYEWYRCKYPGTASDLLPRACTRINGATKSSYVITASDLGYYLRVANTAKIGRAALQSYSSSTALIDTLPVVDSIRVSAISNGVKSINGAWKSGTKIGLAYQWYSCAASLTANSAGIKRMPPLGCQSIAGATTPNLNYIRSQYLGRHILLGVTATNGVGSASYFTASVPVR